MLGFVLVKPNQVGSSLKHCTGVLYLEPQLSIPRVELETFVQGSVAVHGGNGASSGATTVVGNQVVLYQALRHTAIDTVAKKQIGATSGVASDISLACSCKELSLERGGVLAKPGHVFSHEVSHYTGCVRTSHRSTGEKIDNRVASAPCTENLFAGCVDVDAFSNIGEGRDLVLDVDRANRDNIGIGATQMCWR